MTVAGLAPLTVAAVQAESRAGDVTHNVATAGRWVKAAAGHGARLVVLPELFLPGYDPRTLRAQPDSCDVTVADPRLRPLAEIAATERVAVVVGASVRNEDGSRSLALVSFAPDGSIDVPYVKQHLWDEERDIFTPGDRGATVQLSGWPLGLGVCYDGCFPEHARAAADVGALVYVCPSAYVVGSEHRRDLYYAARAIENGVYVVFSGLAGQCGDLEMSGGTAVYDPQGRAVGRVAGSETEGLVVVDLETAEIDLARRINPFPRDRISAEMVRRVVVMDQAGTHERTRLQ